MRKDLIELEFGNHLLLFEFGIEYELGTEKAYAWVECVNSFDRPLIEEVYETARNIACEKLGILYG